jgi:hypothetical protein
MTLPSPKFQTNLPAWYVPSLFDFTSPPSRKGIPEIIVLGINILEFIFKITLSSSSLSSSPSSVSPSSSSPVFSSPLVGSPIIQSLLFKLILLPSPGLETKNQKHHPNQQH